MNSILDSFVISESLNNRKVENVRNPADSSENSHLGYSIKYPELMRINNEEKIRFFSKVQFSTKSIFLITLDIGKNLNIPQIEQFIYKPLDGLDVKIRFREKEVKKDFYTQKLLYCTLTLKTEEDVVDCWLKFFEYLLNNKKE